MTAAPAQIHVRPFLPPIYDPPASQPLSPTPVAATSNYDPGRSLYSLPSPTTITSPIYDYQPAYPDINPSNFISQTTAPSKLPLPSFIPPSSVLHNDLSSILRSTPDKKSKLNSNGRKSTTSMTSKNPTKSGSVTGQNSNPGPIKATTPTKTKDANGVHWIEFDYSRERISTQYVIRCDIESVDLDKLDEYYKDVNCVYPRALNKAQYKGNRFQYETECNELGWALTALNAPLRGKRGLIQRAVDSWRNSFNFRSRRVRRIDKTNRRRELNRAYDPFHLNSITLPSSDVPDAVRSSLDTTSTSHLHMLYHHHDSENGVDDNTSGMFHHV